MIDLFLDNRLHRDEGKFQRNSKSNNRNGWLVGFNVGLELRS